MTDMAMRAQVHALRRPPNARGRALEKLQTQLAAARHELLTATRGELVAVLAQRTLQTIVAMIGTGAEPGRARPVH